MISERCELICEGMPWLCRNAKGNRHTSEHAVAFEARHYASEHGVSIKLIRALTISFGAGSCKRKRDQLTTFLRKTIKIITMVDDLVGEEQTCGCRRLAVQPRKAFEHHADA